MSVMVEHTPFANWVRPYDFKGLKLQRPIVLVNGAFDLLHIGHLRILHQAKLRAGTLVAALDSDDKVCDLKGPGRPILDWVERATMLAFLGVEYIVEIASDEEMRRTIKWLKPDFRVLGEDWKDKPTRFPEIRRMFVKRNGKSISTTEIIRRCKVAAI